MRLIDLKRAFALGSLVKATIAPNFNRDWVLLILCSNGETVTMHKDRDGVREFKTTAAAIEAAKSIGFDEVLIKGICVK